MKAFFSFLLAALFLIHPANAGESAREVLNRLPGLIGPTEAAQVVAVLGVRGQDQPDRWQVLIGSPQTPGFLKELTMEGGRIIGQRFLELRPGSDLPTRPFSLKQVQTDSTEAFRLAQQRATAAGVGFDFINYQLRFRGTSQEPTWLVTLLDVNGVPVGNLTIRAATGTLAGESFRHPQNSGSRTMISGPTRLPVTSPQQPGLWSAPARPARNQPVAPAAPQAR